MIDHDGPTPGRRRRKARIFTGMICDGPEAAAIVTMTVTVTGPAAGHRAPPRHRESAAAAATASPTLTLTGPPGRSVPGRAGPGRG